MKNYQKIVPTHKLKWYCFTTEAMLKYQYKGCLGQHNKPNYHCQTYLFQSMFGIAHFHISLN